MTPSSEPQPVESNLCNLRSRQHAGDLTPFSAVAASGSIGLHSVLDLLHLPVLVLVLQVLLQLVLWAVSLCR